jgi:translation elongation factor EF-Tu-like GTPase
MVVPVVVVGVLEVVVVDEEVVVVVVEVEVIKNLLIASSRAQDHSRMLASACRARESGARGHAKLDELQGNYTSRLTHNAQHVDAPAAHQQTPTRWCRDPYRNPWR